MSAPNSPSVNSTPAQPGQPYDATDQGAVDQWVKLTAGAASLANGRRTGDDWPSTGLWQQT